MSGTCTCPLRGKHVRLESSFDAEGLQRFISACRPSCETVFGRVPQVGESLCAFSGSYPLPAMQHLLELQLPALHRLKEPFKGDRRHAHVPPRWIGDLGCCLHWKTIIQYRFKRLNHININEELALRSLLKHTAKRCPSTRFGILLDSRVAIGCNAKGRSSSAKLNFCLSTCLPYVLGGDVYPSFFHIGTGENVADDPSRLKALRHSCPDQPLWLRGFLRGDWRLLNAVKLSDDCAAGLNGWARLATLLLVLRSDASTTQG